MIMITPQKHVYRHIHTRTFHNRPRTVGREHLTRTDNVFLFVFGGGEVPGRIYRLDVKRNFKTERHCVTICIKNAAT